MCEWIRYFCGVCKCVCRSCAFALEGQMLTLDVIPQKLIPLFYFLVFGFIYAYASVYGWVQCPLKTEEGDGYHGTGVTDPCELLDMGASKH